MHPQAVESPPPAGEGGYRDPNAAVLGILSELLRIATRLLASYEQEPDFDQTFIVGGNLAAAQAVPFQLPRTLKHVEITLSTTTGNEVALIDGNQSTAQAQAQHSHAAVGQSNAIATTSGGAVTAREFLSGVGTLTVLFTAASNGYANVRIRSLDKTQGRARRT